MLSQNADFFANDQRFQTIVFNAVCFFNGIMYAFCY
nr:MAG TPA: hypothetical protein [Bacteriophage sp.]